jgi:ABC-type antimicrobial peptide transport system permease subunit
LIALLSISGLAMPAFWLGLLSQWLFYDVLGWFPAGGRLDLGLTPPAHKTGLYTVDSLLAGRLDLFGNTVWHLVLPATVLGLGTLGVIARMIRGSLIEDADNYGGRFAMRLFAERGHFGGNRLLLAGFGAVYHAIDPCRRLYADCRHNSGYRRHLCTGEYRG